MKKIITIIIILVVLVGGYALLKGNKFSVENSENRNGANSDEIVEDDPVEEVDETKTVIGSSVDGNDITTFHYGEGSDEILFVGGIHGGYSWNTALVAYELMDYLEDDPSVIPDNLKVTVIPVLNPDGLDKIVGSTGMFSKSDAPKTVAEGIPGRFNANEVDLNRNFDCEWKETSKWQNKDVSGGSKPFSEPESQAIRDYVKSNNPEAVIVWYSSAGGVFSSSCKNGVLSDTATLTNLYAKAAGYKAFEEFNFYEVSGDMVNWFAKERITAISVLLSSFNDVEWDKNLEGILSVFDYYAE
jgi:hypothetical protein